MQTNQDNIELGDSLSEGLVRGIEKVTNVIRQSYGPKGGNVSVEVELYPGHMVCNDLQSFIQHIYLEDPIERRGLNFLKELSDKQSKNAGEGRKTTAIIAETLLKEGLAQRVDGMKLKNELDALLPQVLESIDKQSQQVELKDIYSLLRSAFKP